jgi:Flp pilus assembly protein TadG
VRRRAARWDDDRGAVTLEFVVLAPALLALLGLLVVAGRVAIASNSVEAAADEAARSASISRTAAGARAAGEEGARRGLAEQDLTCTTVRVDVDTAGFAVPVGLPAQVRATVTCVVRLADLALPGFPGSRTVTATAVSPLDTYRERG